MKNRFFLLGLMTTCFVALAAQTEEKVKTGWNLGALPSFLYDSDIGFQYGALVKLFQYGDGSLYPEYRYTIYAEWSRQTKGGAINQIVFDAPHLLPKEMRLTFDLSYLTEKALDFYGYNAYSSTYYPAFEDVESPEYISRMYYRHQRKMLRLLTDLHGRLNANLRWVGGIGYFDIRLASVDIQRMNEGKEGSDLLPDTALLFDKYLAWGILPGSQAKGGSNLLLKAGLVFDSRDQEANPSRGIWSEFLLTGSPSLMGDEGASFIRYSLIHRQYHSIIKEKLSLAYRLGAQGTLVGESPHYLLSYMLSSYNNATNHEGLGGARSMRGILRNRVIGEGMAYSNLELRWKFYKTLLWNQNIYLALNAFTDAGIITVPMQIEMEKIPVEERWENKTDRPHLSSGAGFRIAMNQNFIIAVDYGRAWSKQDGEEGLYISLGYLF